MSMVGPMGLQIVARRGPRTLRNFMGSKVGIYIGLLTHYIFYYKVGGAWMWLFQVNVYYMK